MKTILTLFLTSCTIFSYAQTDPHMIEKKMLAGFGTEISGKGAVVDDLKQGKWKYYTNKEEQQQLLFAEGTYKDNMKVGNWKTYYPDVKQFLKTKEIYKNDSLFVLKFMTKKQKRSFEIIATNGLGKLTTNDIELISYNLPVIMLNNSGMYGTKKEETIRQTSGLIAETIYKHGDEATIKFWDVNDLLAESWSVTKDGVENYRYEYFSGKLSKVIVWNKEVMVSVKELVLNNEQNFLLTHYYPNKRKKEKQQFVRSTIKEGKWEAFHENGKKKWVKTYKNNVLHGTLKEWDAEGKLMKKEEYENGVLIG